MKRLFACLTLAAICAAVAAFGWNNESSARNSGPARGTGTARLT